MVEETILQHWIFTSFVFPFLLMFFIVFAILEKTSILGKEKKQLNALLAFVIGLIFVSAVYPKIVVGNLILFLTVALVIVFVTLLLWGFVTGGEAKITNNAVKWIAGIGGFVIIVFAVFWAMGIDGTVFDFLFRQSWSKSLWTNISFIVVIGAALALVYTGSKK